MSKYECKTCKQTKELLKTTSVFRNGKLVAKEAICDKCGKYMDYIEEKFKGFPTIIRNEEHMKKN